MSLELVTAFSGEWQPVLLIVSGLKIPVSLKGGWFWIVFLDSPQSALTDAVQFETRRIVVLGSVVSS